MEYQIEAIFLHSCYLNGGCRTTPYTPICASGALLCYQNYYYYIYCIFNYTKTLPHHTLHAHLRLRCAVTLL